MVRRLPPTAFGSVMAAIGGGIYTIANYELHLWTSLWRVEIMGASVLLLVTSLVSWTFLELHETLRQALEKGSKYEWWLRVAAQVSLSGSLVALGIDLRAFLLLFLGFYILSTCWTLLVRRIADALDRTTASEIANLFLCVIFVTLTYILYDRAIDFEHTYASFVSDSYSFQLRQAFMRDKVVNIPPILFGCVTLMVANLVRLISLSDWRPKLLQTEV